MSDYIKCEACGIITMLRHCDECDGIFCPECMTTADWAEGDRPLTTICNDCLHHTYDSDTDKAAVAIKTRRIKEKRNAI